MRHLLLVCVLGTACGSDSDKRVDAAVAGDDALTDALGDATPDSSTNLTLDCASYCGGIMAACIGANAQYASMQNCLDSCADFPAGSLGQTSMNTLGCRVYHTEAARTNADSHCVHAGPGGGSMCGADLCEGFCSIVVAECPTEWPNAGGCATECANFGSSGQPFSTAATGDTVECRLYHATMAATSPSGHCTHTDVNSAVCQ